MSLSEKKHIIEKQRHKIVGRLDSAEKLLRTRDGQLFAGKELESLMEAIYSLKKKVQLVNKLSVSTKLYEDMIIREANILTKRGYPRASDVLFKIAQGAPITPAPPANPTTGGGNPGTIPGDAPGQAPAPNDPPINDGMKGLEHRILLLSCGYAIGDRRRRRSARTLRY